MILLENDRLTFLFNDVHADARCSIEFQRTLRIPDDDSDYPLPPGLGRFPVRHLDDYAARLPATWHGRGGVIAPMHQGEALWIRFTSRYPFAVKVATGKICAVTGDTWTNHLNRDPQDYLAVPEQPWLDGYCVEEGVVRQFVAMPLGEGYTVEEQLTGAAEHGGLQLMAYPIKAERYQPAYLEPALDMFKVAYSPSPSMGLAPGGRMKQEIYNDPHEFEAWDQRHGSRCFVSLVNTVQWMAITGEQPPHEPPTAQDYAAAGLPWFNYYGGDVDAVAGSKRLSGLRSVMQQAKGQAALAGNQSVNVRHVIPLGKARRVRESADGD